MLVSWLHWKEDKATVGRLAKALFLNDQLEAIECLSPWTIPNNFLHLSNLNALKHFQQHKLKTSLTF